MPARNRVIAAVNEAGDTFRPTGVVESIRLPVLIAPEPGDSAYAEDALYDLEREPGAEALAPETDAIDPSR